MGEGTPYVKTKSKSKLKKEKTRKKKLLATKVSLFEKFSHLRISVDPRRTKYRYGSRCSRNK